MSSKRRLRRKRCTGKARHETVEAARLAVSRTVRSMGGRVGHLSAYRCGSCGAWHIGHTPGMNGSGQAWR